MTVFARETPESVLDEIRPLAVDHYRELAAWRDVPYDPDFEVYLGNPNVRLFTVRDSGVLIGYSVWFLCAERYSRNVVAAIEDAIYLDPEFRGRTIGYRFIQYCEDELGEEADIVYHHVNVSRDWSRVLEQMGHELVDVTYARRLR